MHETVLITGLDEIGIYVGRHRNTVAQWIRVHGFPASRLPNGRYVTSTALIDSWILARMNEEAVFSKSSLSS